MGAVGPSFGFYRKRYADLTVVGWTSRSAIRPPGRIRRTAVRPVRRAGRGRPAQSRRTALPYSPEVTGQPVPARAARTTFLAQPLCKTCTAIRPVLSHRELKGILVARPAP